MTQPAPKDCLRVAVAGNPNSGKTTLFNALTGQNAHIGNYPGITVERRTGALRLPDAGRVELVDVPGTYSLYARSRDEEVAINELLGRKGLPRPHAAVLVLDALSLERGLYLLVQVQEFEVPVVVAVNMMDSARAEGVVIDLAALSEAFGAPFIGVSARFGEGVNEVRSALDTLLTDENARTPQPWRWRPNPELEADLEAFEQPLEEEVGFLSTAAQRHAFALWLLFSINPDSDLQARPRLAELAYEHRRRAAEAGRDLETEVIVPRYHFIDQAAARAVRRPRTPSSATDRIDAILTHPLWGMLVFIVIMAALFQALFAWSEPFIAVIEDGFGLLAQGVRTVLPDGFWQELLADGVVAGVGGVLSFLPQIILLFLFIALLEGSGYLARAAFLMDRLMRAVGLHGHAFVPMLSGFACTVPAIMATRTMEHRRDRILTILALPLVSCSARLPVYALITGLLFPAGERIGFISIGALALLGIYVASTVMALLAAAVLGRTLFRGRPQPLLLELPPYRLPDLRSVLLTIQERSRVFVSTAGSIILVMTVALWLLLRYPGQTPDMASLTAAGQGPGTTTSLPASAEAHAEAARIEHSYAGRLGKTLEPVIAPLGFDWKIGIGLIGAFAAREVFVSTMGVVYGVGGDDEDAGLRSAMRNDRRPDGTPLWTPLTGLSLIVFFMIALQCISTLAVARRETGGWGLPAFMLAYMTLLAWLASFVVYQGGRALGLGV